jgi:hypothetical protein
VSVFLETEPIALFALVLAQQCFVVPEKLRIPNLVGSYEPQMRFTVTDVRSSPRADQGMDDVGGTALVVGNSSDHRPVDVAAHLDPEICHRVVSVSVGGWKFLPVGVSPRRSAVERIKSFCINGLI